MAIATDSIPSIDGDAISIGTFNDLDDSPYTVIGTTEITGWSGADTNGIWSQADHTTFKNLLIHDPAANASHAISFQDNATLNVENNIFYNLPFGAVTMIMTYGNTAANTRVNIYNNTAWNVCTNSGGGCGSTFAAIGFENTNADPFAGTVLDVRNNIVHSPNLAFRLSNHATDPGAWHASSTNNISSDTTTPGSNAKNTRTFTDNPFPSAGNYVIFNSLQAGSENLHLVNTSENDAMDAGAAITGLNTDIDGETRTGTSDAGAG